VNTTYLPPAWDLLLSLTPKPGTKRSMVLCASLDRCNFKNDSWWTL